MTPLNTLQHPRHGLGPSSALHAKERGFSSTWKRLTQPKAAAGLALPPPQLLLPLPRPVAAHRGTSVPTLTAGIGNAASCCSTGLTSMRKAPAFSSCPQPPAGNSNLLLQVGLRVQDGCSSRVLHLHHKGRVQGAPAVGQDKESRKMDRTLLCVLTPGNPG